MVATRPASAAAVSNSLRLPLGECCLHGLALVLAAEQLQHAIAVVREVGVEADVAVIARGVDAGDLVPHRAGRLAGDAQIALAAELDGGVAHVDRHCLVAAAALLVELRRGQPGGGDRGLRECTDAERGRQRRLLACEHDGFERGQVPAGHGPEIGEDVRRRCAIGGNVSHPPSLARTRSSGVWGWVPDIWLTLGTSPRAVAKFRDDSCAGYCAGRVVFFRNAGT